MILVPMSILIMLILLYHHLKINKQNAPFHCAPCSRARSIRKSSSWTCLCRKNESKRTPEPRERGLQNLKWPFWGARFWCAPFSSTNDLCNGRTRDSGVRSDSECADRMRPHLNIVVSKFEFSTRSVAKVTPIFPCDRERGRTDVRTYGRPDS